MSTSSTATPRARHNQFRLPPARLLLLIVASVIAACLGRTAIAATAAATTNTDASDTTTTSTSTGTAAESPASTMAYVTRRWAYGGQFAVLPPAAD